MPDLNLFIPITKADAAKRLVYGLATAETEDRSGEICDYASTKPNYEKWSGDIAKTTNGKSFGNLRAMHGNIAAGKVTSIAFNDDANQIEICAKVVDEAEWTKISEGVYTGFSQGGSYEKRWTDDAGLTRYTACPSEISLVGLPCLPGATFQMIKADGVAEARHFQKKAGEDGADGKDGAAGNDGKDCGKSGHKMPTPVSGDGYEQVWRSKIDGTVFRKKDDLLAHNARMAASAAVAGTTKPVIDALDALDEKLGIQKRDFSDKERENAADSGEAMEDGSYPIKAAGDVENAVKDYNRTGQDPKVKAHIIARAKALDAADMLPADWEGSTKKPDKAAAIRELAKYAGSECQDSAQAIAVLAQLYDLLGGEEGAGEPDEQATNLRAAIASVKAFVVSEIQEEGSGDNMNGPATAAMAYAARSYLRKMDAHREDLDNIKRHAGKISGHAMAIMKGGMPDGLEKVKAIHRTAQDKHSVRFNGNVNAIMPQFLPRRPETSTAYYPPTRKTPMADQSSTQELINKISQSRVCVQRRPAASKPAKSIDLCPIRIADQRPYVL